MSRRTHCGHGAPNGIRGFTIVEALVATSVFGINLTAMVAVLLLSFSLFRRSATILDGIADLSIVDACQGALLGPTIVMQRMRCRFRRLAGRLSSHGLTLVEVLVALAMTTILMLVIASFVTSVHGGTRAAEARADRHLLEHALGLVFAGEMANAGARLAADECGVAIDQDGRAIHAWARDTEGTLQLRTITAGVDGAGRPALYRRHHPHSRQPWLEDVTDFHVELVESSTEIGRRVAAIFVRIEVAGHDTVFELHMDLPHRPCRTLAP